MSDLPVYRRSDNAAVVLVTMKNGDVNEYRGGETTGLRVFSDEGLLVIARDKVWDGKYDPAFTMIPLADVAHINYRWK